MSKKYPITSVCKDDLIDLWEGIDSDMNRLALKLDDTDMKWIAENMADAYLNCCFWDSLRQITEEAIKRKEVTK